MYLEPGHHQEEWLTVPVPLLQIVNPLPHETLCEVLESDRLLHEVVVPHDDRVQQLHVVGDEEEVEERREDGCTEDNKPTRSEHSVRLQQPAPKHCTEQDGQQRRVHVDVEAGQYTHPIVTEVLQIGQRDAVEIIEALIQRMVTEVVVVAAVHPQMPLPCRRKHTNILLLGTHCNYNLVDTQSNIENIKFASGSNSWDNENRRPSVCKIFNRSISKIILPIRAVEYPFFLATSAMVVSFGGRPDTLETNALTRMSCHAIIPGHPKIYVVDVHP